MSAAPNIRGIRRRALLDSGAFASALESLVARLGGETVIDVRADAYGHGRREVEERAQRHGVRHFVRSTTDAIALADHGVEHALEPYGFTGPTDPIMRLSGEVVAVKRVPPGAAVSYGYTYRTQQESTLALVALGYADGVPRAASNRAPVRIGMTTGVVAGRIAMDQLVVDLGLASTEPGAEAVLWDDAASLLAWVTACDRPAQVITAGLGRRVHREWSVS